ncbi:MAG: hypothetical protein GKR99_18480 [Rhodobacteraceae bacterium]|nr:hypothetical protein [Paracoccaceae bacterium]
MTETTQTTRPGRDIPWDAIGIAAGLALLAMNLWRHRLFVHDDSFISLRYARNLAEHGQLVWNLGERVEGYTNFLHVVASAGLIRIGFDPLAAAQSLNVAAAVLLLVVAARAGRLVAPDAPVARAAAVPMIGASPGVAIWTLGGLEAVPVAALLGLGMYRVLRIVNGDHGRGTLLAALAFSLAVLTRLDTAVFIAGAGLGLMLATNLSPGRRVGLAVLIVGVPAAVAFAHMGWRVWYYGEYLPLTFHAKTGLPTLARLSFFPRYALASLLPALIVTLGLLGFVALLRRPPSAGLARLLGVPMLAYLLYVGWAGGDHMLGARLFLPVLVSVAMLVLLAITHLSDGRDKPVSLIALALVAVTGLQIPSLKQDEAAFMGRLLGLHFAETLPKGSTIALHTAGSTPYFATDNTFIDMLGLNDPHIARRNPVPMLATWQEVPGHSKGDGAYVLEREPDVIVVGSARGILIDDEPWFLSDAELAQLPEFRECYAPDTVFLDAPDAIKWRGPATVWPIRFAYYTRSCS